MYKKTNKNDWVKNGTFGNVYIMKGLKVIGYLLTGSFNMHQPVLQKSLKQQWIDSYIAYNNKALACFGALFNKLWLCRVYEPGCGISPRLSLSHNSIQTNIA